ncbi:hypothetical protein BHE97_19375 [Aeromicrobium sp. PE09-221]|nr:hypothetical protein BHE97_19375 [Aeromicrobium sp. PE09-221]
MIGAVSALYDLVFAPSIKGFWIVLFILLLMPGVLGNLQTRTKVSLDIERLFRAVWRIGFVILLFFYVLFSIIGVIQSISAM